MSLAVRQIKKALLESYGSHIDMTDLPEGQRDEAHMLSRALAAFYIENQTSLTAAEAGKCVTDSFEDNGIDAVYFDAATKTLYLVQSKFISSGTGSPEQGDVMKFAAGVKLMVNADFASFSDKFKSIIPVVDTALDDPNIRIVVALVCTGNSFSAHVTVELQRLVDEINNPIELVSIDLSSISNIHGWLRDSVTAKEVEFELMLQEWGATQQPLVSYYGQVSGVELADIYAKHRHQLFNQNIRKFLGDTEINDAIIATTMATPDQLLFHNNGVVIICESLAKTAKGGANRDAGTFVCKGAQVVNGAQTIGAISNVAERNRETVSSARLLVRLIEVPKGREDLAGSLTRSTNTQNRVDKKDFVTLDTRHERYKIDLRLDGVEYLYKSGDKPTGTMHFTLEEAVAALACHHGTLDYAIQAKKEIGRLWERIDATPYTDLFPDSLTHERLWRIVQMARRIDLRLGARSKPAGDERNLAVHGGKILQHIVFKSMDPAVKNTSSRGFDVELDSRTDAAFAAMLDVRKAAFSDSYLGRMFYNTTKTKDFVDQVLSKLV